MRIRMRSLSAIRRILFVIILLGSAAPAVLGAKQFDECYPNDCHGCGVGLCFLPLNENCWDWFNCASWHVGTCTIGEDVYTQCYCGPCAG